MDYEIIQLKTCTSDQEGMGKLSFVESSHDIPFEIKRIYYIYNVDAGIHRGFHAHKLNKQLLYCPYGKIEIIVDDGKNKESVILDNPSKGLVLYPGLWREMIWQQKDSVLCVAASEYYEENEYIRNYDEFLEYVNNK